jgi:hypothetical protein
MPQKSRRCSVNQILQLIQNLCGWILTALFAVIAIAMLWYSNLTRVIYLGFAIVLCPAIKVPVTVRLVVVALGLFLL